MTDVEAALEALDEDAARTALIALTGTVLPCVSGVVGPTRAARVHRLMALHLYGLGEAEGARRSAAAASSLDGADFDPRLLPPDHPLRTTEPVVRPLDRVPEPREGWLAFDGTTGFRRPRGLPTVAQRLDSTGTPTWTAYVGPREPLVPYEAVPRTRNAFLACAAGALVAGSAVSGLAWSTRQSLPRKARDPAVSAESLDAGRARANGLQVVGLGAFMGAGACGAGAWVWR